MRQRERLWQLRLDGWDGTRAYGVLSAGKGVAGGGGARLCVRVDDPTYACAVQGPPYPALASERGDQSHRAM